MNERNVNAIRELLHQMYLPAAQREAASYGDLPPYEGWARWLAANGVLVPSVLTETQCATVYRASMTERVPESRPAIFDAASQRAALEKIAKGESA